MHVIWLVGDSELCFPMAWLPAIGTEQYLRHEEIEISNATLPTARSRH